jgi:hypothetical protein
MNRSAITSTASGEMFSPRSVASDTVSDYIVRSFRGGPPPIPPKPALRKQHQQQPYYPSATYKQQQQHKYNSLPRRRLTGGTRTVTFRDNLDGGAESDGAASAPEYTMSPTPRHKFNNYTNVQPLGNVCCFIIIIILSFLFLHHRCHFT